MTGKVKRIGGLPLTVGDALIILLVLAAAGVMSAAFAFDRPDGEGDRYAVVISPDGRKEVPLDIAGVFTVNGEGHTLTVAVESGSVYVLDSDCPDRICVSSGRISEPGEMIVCLPAKIMITVETEADAGSVRADGEIDAVAG